MNKPFVSLARLEAGRADLDFVELVISEENRRQRSLRVSELLILSHLAHERSIDTPASLPLRSPASC